MASISANILKWHSTEAQAAAAALEIQEGEAVEEAVVAVIREVTKEEAIKQMATNQETINQEAIKQDTGPVGP